MFSVVVTLLIFQPLMSSLKDGHDENIELIVVISPVFQEEM